MLLLISICSTRKITLPQARQENANAAAEAQQPYYQLAGYDANANGGEASANGGALYDAASANNGYGASYGYGAAYNPYEQAQYGGYQQAYPYYHGGHHHYGQYPYAGHHYAQYPYAGHHQHHGQHAYPYGYGAQYPYYGHGHHHHGYHHGRHYLRGPAHPTPEWLAYVRD